MYTEQVYDRKTFLKKARQTKAEIRVLRTPTVVPVTSGSTVLMRPAIEVQYTIQFVDDSGEWSWVFREVSLADATGRVDLSNTMLNELAASRLRYVLLHRSGSL